MRIADMKLRIATPLIAGCLALAALAGHVNAVDTTPFMLFITPLLPPQGQELSAGFSNACFKTLKKNFAGTSIQVILVTSKDMVDRMSNQKRDIVLSSDPHDYYAKGSTFDTLTIWARYCVGLLHAEIEIPFAKTREVVLPDLVAEHVTRVLKKEMLAEATFEGGPQGMTMTLVEGATIRPPRTMLLPAGEYFVTSEHVGFKTRIDTIKVYPGRRMHKRVLLLP